MSSPPIIEPSWTLEQLRTVFPSVELALFSTFGIGSRERAGFSGTEILADLLRRHLVFDIERACERLNTLAAEDWKFSLGAERLSRLLEGDLHLVDCRSQEDYDICHIPRAELLSRATAEKIKSQPDVAVVAVCADGTQAPAASRVLRAQGLDCVHLKGGLEAWSLEVDPHFPILYSLQEQTGHWYLLADGQTLRFRRENEEPHYSHRVIERHEFEHSEAGRLLLESLPGIQKVISTPTVFAVRPLSTGLSQAVTFLQAGIVDHADWQTLGSPGDEAKERAALETALVEISKEVLASHKGTVEVKNYAQRVLTLTLGGGCAGCASVNITTKRELAAGLFEAVPLLDRIENDS